MNVRGFNFTIFRKHSKQVFNPGGLWDAATEMYSPISGAVMRRAASEYVFADRRGKFISKVVFAHIDRDEELLSWQGSELCGIGFDELCHFNKKQFFYMLSRNRSKCGVRPFIRATCNPDPDSWVADFISWWIDPDTGYAIPERSGVIRWMLRRGEEIYWADSREELWERFNLKTKEERREPKSVTFIASSIYDNKALLAIDPGYLANLKALPEVDRERLLYGNWKIKAAAGLYFKRSQVEMVEIAPVKLKAICRAWDIAATEDKETGDPDYTAGVLIGKTLENEYIVLDVINQRIKAGEVAKLIKNTAIADKAKYGLKCQISIPKDPGAAGVIVANNYVKMLSGFPVTVVTPTGAKQVRATPFAAQWQNGNVKVLAAPWNEAYFTQLESFPESKHDDMVDASSDSFTNVAEAKFNVGALI